MKFALIATAGSLLIAGTAVAQGAPATPPPPPQQSSTAGSAASTTVSQAEVDQFAKAVLHVQKIGADAALAQDQKQAAMVAAVQESGLQPQRFNQIAEAAKTDKALNERVQMAAARQVQAAQPKP